MDNTNKQFKKIAQTVAVTGLLTLPLFSHELQAQAGIRTKTTFHAIPIKGKEISAVTIVGVDKGNTVFKDARGEFFTVNPKTGDLEFIPAVKFGTFKVVEQQQTTASKPLVGIKYPPMKEGTTVTILGVNKDGQTIHKNSRGEVFYVHPTTGDFIYQQK